MMTCFRVQNDADAKLEKEEMWEFFVDTYFIPDS